MNSNEEMLWELAREYHRRAEEFDLSILSGNGAYMIRSTPATPSEEAAINRHAAQLWREMIARSGGDAVGFRRAVWRYAASRQFEQDAEQIRAKWEGRTQEEQP